MNDPARNEELAAAPAPTTYQRLAAPFAISEHGTVNKGGMLQTYAPWTEYVERLNEVLGVHGWSERVVREGMTETEAWVLVEIEAEIDGKRVVRQQYGCEPILKGQDRKPVADLFKATASDALKKAASLLGVGLYLSVRDEREAIQQQMRDAVNEAAGRGRASGGRQGPPDAWGGANHEPAQLRPSQAQEAPPAPLDAGERAALEHRYESLREHAIQAGFQSSWSGKGSAAWNDLQLPKYIGLLEQFIRRVQVAS